MILNSQKDKLNQIKIELNNIEKQKQALNSRKLHEILEENNSIEYFEKYTIENKGINNFKLVLVR